jgi:predicted RNA-binding protein YlqC (UPF0109 family)
MNNESHPITQALTTVVRGICSKPQDLEVIERETGNFLEVEYRPSMQDIRVLIGRGWRQKNALVTVAAAMGRRMDTLTEFTIVDSDRGEKRDPRPVTRTLTKESLIEVIRPVINLALGDVVWKVEDLRSCLAVEIFTPENDAPTVIAVGDLFFAWAKAQGGRVEVKFRLAKNGVLK